MTSEERNQQVLDNLPLVTYVVKKMYLSPYAFYSREDMYQEGVIGLMAAVDRFDPSRGVQFSTYAVPLIQGQINRFIRDNFQSFHYSRSDIEAYAKIIKTGKSLDELTADEIENLQLTEKNISAIRSMNAPSLNSPISENGDTELGSFIQDMNSSEVSDEYQLQVIENIKNAVISKMQPEKQDLIDEWYYSKLIGLEPSQSYLGRKYGMSQVSVSRNLCKFKEDFAKKLHDSGYDVPNYLD